MDNVSSRRGESPRLPDWSGFSLLQRPTHAYRVEVNAMGGLHSFRRATGDIGLSSLAGGNDFGLLVAHSIDFYLFGVMMLRPKGLLSSGWREDGRGAWAAAGQTSLSS